MEPGAKKIVDDIRSLSIQGARNIAKAALDAQRLQITKTKAKSTDKVIAELNEVKEELEAARSTEPALRNYLLLLFNKIEETHPQNVDDLRIVVLETCDKIEKLAKQSVEKIWLYGSRKIPNNGKVLVHCHSSTLVGALIRAWKEGKRFEVYSTETRPRFQGRLTAEDLAKAGIPVTHIIDSAAASFMPNIDLVLMGCDALTAEGSVVNKIGSKGIAIAAHYYGVPVYVCGESFKYDPVTLWGYNEPIEERDPKELGFSMKGVRISNPSFDLTPANLVTGIITEHGVIAPQLISLYAPTKV